MNIIFQLRRYVSRRKHHTAPDVEITGSTIIDAPTPLSTLGDDEIEIPFAAADNAAGIPVQLQRCIVLRAREIELAGAETACVWVANSGTDTDEGKSSSGDGSGGGRSVPRSPYIFRWAKYKTFVWNQR